MCDRGVKEMGSCKQTDHEGLKGGAISYSQRPQHRLRLDHSGLVLGKLVQHTSCLQVSRQDKWLEVENRLENQLEVKNRLENWLEVEIHNPGKQF